MLNSAPPPTLADSSEPTPAVESTTMLNTPTLGEYRLVSRLGQGGIAEVYKAIQMKLDREVAVKILSVKLSKDPDIVRRFDRESVTIAKLNHPHIVQVYDRGFSHGRYYFVMEYVQGVSFKEALLSREVATVTKIEMLIMALKALDYAHKNGVIHRDIKPANILIDMNGSAKVADFGIAQIIGAPEEERTSADVIMGTLAYMSPEQKLSSRNVDYSTDIYAVGVILYEILTGQKPLGKFKMPSEIDTRIPQEFDRVISTCLAQNAAERYRSAVALKDELLEIISGQNKTRHDTRRTVMTGIEAIAGKCQFLDTIKETSFGATYLVEQTDTKKLYVIKRHGKGQSGLREAKILCRTTHPHIIRVIGAGGDMRKTVLVTEYAPGGSLADRMVRRYEWLEAFTIIEKIADGLAFAHSNDIIHGDLRPSNILFDANETPKLTDFGLPPHYGASGKDWYMAPEKTPSVRSDLYSMGVILHQMMLGRMPAFDRDGALYLDEIRLNTPVAVKSMLLKLVEARIGHRYQSVDQFLADWRDYRSQGHEPAVASKMNEPSQIIAPRSRSLNKWLMIAAALGVGIGIGLAVGKLAGMF